MMSETQADAICYTCFRLGKGKAKSKFRSDQHLEDCWLELATWSKQDQVPRTKAELIALYKGPMVVFFQHGLQDPEQRYHRLLQKRKPERRLRSCRYCCGHSSQEPQRSNRSQRVMGLWVPRKLILVHLAL